LAFVSVLKELIKQNIHREIVDLERNAFPTNGTNVLDVLEVLCFYAWLAEALIETNDTCDRT
jgi:hypothetical protein